MRRVCNMSKQGARGKQFFAADLQSNAGVSLLLPVNL